MRRLFYIFSFMVLGLLLGTLAHAGLEIPALALVTNDFERYGDSFFWRHWGLIHGWGGIVLWAIGLILGFVAGRKFWQILYVEKRYGAPRW